MNKIYISGPITGRPLEDCHIAFQTAAHELKRKGYEIVNPLDVQGSGDCKRPEKCAEEVSKHEWLCWMRADIVEMMDCDAVYALGGWQGSKGARVEVGLADSLGIRVYYEDLKHDVPVPNKTF